MKSKIFSCITILTCFLFFNAKADNIKIRLYAGVTVSSIQVEPHTGRYIIAADNEEFLLPASGDAELSIKNSKIQVKVSGRNKGNFKNVTFYSKDSLGILKLTPNQNPKLKREYEGDFIFSASGASIQAVNDINLERYIAAVVQAEIYGKPDQLDIFKVQSVISRTWALKNMQKHKNDGYNVCDGVHCQAYKNRCLRNEILQATQETHDEVMIDDKGNLIEAVFHSNSGGQTVNSEDFWQSPLPYLRSIVDTFSYGMKMSTWEVKMPKNEWLSYFKNTHKLDTRNKKISSELLSFQQGEVRKTKICDVSLRSVREDLKLRSTYFDVIEDGNEVRICGKGFGHGVGLSQEGAIRMVELGYPYHDILTFYYTGAKLKKPEGIYEPTEKPVVTDTKVIISPKEQIAVKEEIVNKEKPTFEKKEGIRFLNKDKKKRRKEKAQGKAVEKKVVKKEEKPVEKPTSYPEEEAEFEIIVD